MAKLQVVVTDDFKTQVDDVAKRKGISTSSMVKIALSEYLGRNGQGKDAPEEPR